MPELKQCICCSRLPFRPHPPARCQCIANAADRAGGTSCRHVPQCGCRQCGQPRHQPAVDTDDGDLPLGPSSLWVPPLSDLTAAGWRAHSKVEPPNEESTQAVSLRHRAAVGILQQCSNRNGGSGPAEAAGAGQFTTAIRWTGPSRK